MTDHELRQEAIRLRVEEQLTKDAIAKRLRKCRSWVKRALVGVPSPAGMYGSPTFQTPPPWQPDLRSKCAKLCGDPPPGRSALDQRRQA